MGSIGRPLASAAAAIRAAGSLLIATHVNPDGDALGSLCGLALACERLGKQTTRSSVDGVPELYAGLPSAERVLRAAPLGPFDLGIGVDADGSDRLGSAEAAILSCATVIDIDHHTGADRYGTLQLLDPTAAATGELVFELIRELGVPLDREIAECLMMALVTDTGSFRFPSVKPRTLRIAAELMEAGAHPAPIVEQVYGQRSAGATRLFGRALERMERLPGGRFVWSTLSQGDFLETGAREDETDGIINELRAVRDVRAGHAAARRARRADPGQLSRPRRRQCRRPGGRVRRRWPPRRQRRHAPGPMAAAVRRVIAAAERALPQ